VYQPTPLSISKEALSLGSTGKNEEESLVWLQFSRRAAAERDDAPLRSSVHVPFAGPLALLEANRCLCRESSERGVQQSEVSRRKGAKSGRRYLNSSPSWDELRRRRERRKEAVKQMEEPERGSPAALRTT